PVIVWIHGGAWISGARGDIANYLRILAGRGMVTVGVDYSIAPASRYPAPLRQVNRALGFLSENSAELGIDPGRIVLAGDSAGSQIAAQVAALTTDPGYASKIGIEPRLRPGQLRAALLNCGAYDLNLASGKGLQGWFLGTALRAYSGSRDYLDLESFRLASVAGHVSDRFPPTFITAGNDDPLLPHSVAMARRLTELGVTTDPMFFDPDHRPRLGHEYQFDLELAEGREALERMVGFVQDHATLLQTDTSLPS
ncbi:MAG: alpha/beta hydrolase, partial [Actinomycetota bacterium]|nr:alpha/beta hydrolase [Actinomycetota bacterium]